MIRVDRIRLERRITFPRWLDVAVPLGALLSATIAGAILIALSGNDVWDTYSRIVDRAFLSTSALSATIVSATPLLFTGLAAAIAFKMGVFNIGGEGQFVMGAIAGTWFGLQLGPSWGAAAIPVMVAGGAAAGAAWAAIVGALKARFGTNEIITSLMLNYVAINIGYYLIFNSRSAWRLLTGTGAVFPQGKPLDPDVFWPIWSIGGLEIPLGFVIGVAAAIGVFVLYRSTRFGFEVRIIGDSPAAARYAGMRTRRKVVAVMALSGAAAGIGGAADVGDVRHVFDPKGLEQSAYGYAGIVVAALARLNPLAVVVVAILIGGLDNAGRSLQGPGFPAGLVGTLQGMILFFALAAEVLARYRIRIGRTPAAAATSGAAAAAAPEGAS